MKSSFCLSFFLSLILSVSALAQNWPSFRGEKANGVADGLPVATKWNVEKNENIAWKVAIPGLAHASPVVWEDRVYVVTAVSADANPFFKAGPYGDVDSVNETAKYSWRVMALDKKTGKVMWDKVAAEGLPKIKRHTKATHANSTPVTDGQHVVAFFGTEGGLYCFDKKGKLKWKQDLGELDSGWFFDADYQWGAASSPIIYKNLVILQVDVQKGSYIAAWDIKSGKQVWKTERAEIPSWGTPTIVESNNRVELVTNATKALRGYDPLTGKELWSLKGQPEITSTTPVAGHGLIFISNSYRNRFVGAIKQGVANGDISLAEGKTSNDAVAWSTTNSGSYQPSPLLYGEYLYVVNNNGTLNVHDAKTGERAYQKRISEKGSSYSSSPVAANGYLYFPNEDGDIVVIKAGKEYQFVSQNPMGEVLMTTPAISDGMMFVRGQKHLFAIAEKPVMKAQK
jgi:outer membrane protein assembly factor BamB